MLAMRPGPPPWVEEVWGAHLLSKARCGGPPPSRAWLLQPKSPKSRTFRSLSFPQSDDLLVQHGQHFACTRALVRVCGDAPAAPGTAGTLDHASPAGLRVRTCPTSPAEENLHLHGRLQAWWELGEERVGLEGASGVRNVGQLPGQQLPASAGREHGTDECIASRSVLQHCAGRKQAATHQAMMPRLKMSEAVEVRFWYTTCGRVCRQGGERLSATVRSTILAAQPAHTHL